MYMFEWLVVLIPLQKAARIMKYDFDNWKSR